jgi:hypothetical protein
LREDPYIHALGAGDEALDRIASEAEAYSGTLAMTDEQLRDTSG